MPGSHRPGCVTCHADANGDRRTELERAARRFPDRAPGRGGPGHRPGARPRAGAPTGDAGDDRLRELRSPGRARGRRVGVDQQIRRGLPRAPLLRWLRGGRRRRATRDRPGPGAVRGGARQRSAPRGRPGQQRGLHGDAGAGRHDHGAGARPRRPPQPRHEAERLGQAVRGRPLPRQQGRPAGGHGRGGEARLRAQAEGDRRRLVGLPAPARLSRLPRRGRLRRRQADGGHGPLRGARRRGRAPEPGRARGRGHDHRPQDALRPAQRHHPLPRGAGQGHRPLGLPRPAGRAADAHHRRQGRGARDRLSRSRSRPDSARRSPTLAPWARAWPRAAWTCSPAAPTCTWCWST